MQSGALYAYYDEGLAELLTKNAAILKQYGWPTTPEDFVRRLAIVWAEEKTALFDIVSDSFGNYSHPGRTDVKVPDDNGGFQPRYMDMLREKERRMPKAPRPPSPPAPQP